MNNKNQRGLDLAAFRRKIHQKGNIRLGLSRARPQLGIQDIPAAVSYLGKKHYYQNILAPITFPKTLDAYPKRHRLSRIDAEREIIWSLCVLALYVPQLKGYVFLRDRYYESYLHESANEASQKLDELESEMGVSRWGLSHRFHLIQESEGLQAQKDLLEKVMSDESLNEIIAWTAYYYSLRAEKNISYSALETQLADFHGEMKDYFINAVVPADQPKIEDPGAPVSWDEPHCLIDRFETCLSMTLCLLARGASPNFLRILRETLEPLDGTGDGRISNIIQLLTGKVIEGESSVLKAADAYTSGRYTEVINMPGAPIELVARAYPLVSDPVVEDTVAARLIKSIIDIRAMSNDTPQLRQRLKKESVFISGHPLFYDLLGFLSRSHDHLLLATPSEQEILACLGGSTHNPWGIRAVRAIATDSNWQDVLKSAYPSSPSLALVEALEAKNLSLLEALQDVIPEYRFASYAGHLAFLMQDYPRAIEYYTSAMKCGRASISTAAMQYLYDVLLAQGEIEKAIDLVVNEVLANPGAEYFFPVRDLVKRGMEGGLLKSKINLAILIQIAAKTKPKLERDLSDIYENILGSVGVDRPSHLRVPDGSDLSQFIYFMRYVCIPRILDDTTSFESVDEIEEERIAICQSLLLIDPDNKAAYLSEIRSLTLEGRVSHLLNKVQTSKIYVDEAGIRQAVEPELKDSFARYLQLRSSPELSYQAEKLSKRLTELLTAKGHPEFKGLKLPASESESLFSQMLVEMTSEFALNPAYGLDTHVSTSIRHGVFEGHLRSTIAAEHLLSSKRDGHYLLSAIWLDAWKDYSPVMLELIGKAIARFTEKFEDFINLYTKEKLHIQVVGGSNLAMFNFQADSERNAALMESLDTDDSYDGFFAKMLEHCWSMTDASLAAIRSDLSTFASSYMASAFDSLVRSIDAAAPHDQVANMLDAVARARTSFQAALDDVSQWFYRPTDMFREPFEPELAAHVSLKQIENCYTKFKISPALKISSINKLDGGYLDGLCEIIFILIQNSIIHSGFEDSGPDLTLEIELVEKVLRISCTNSMSDCVDLCDRESVARDASGNYRQDSAMQMARREGGSGLSKVWRIAEFDLRCGHSIELGITSLGEFKAELILSGLSVS
ncbi:hypothetical protein NB697_002887 [Xanthomonas sacchari]|uniref:hypothetical protein n=1 Tax=Xanthomonas sacchari TaxID=56458 RepID=UPI00224DA994|nr:hypothetical protein [Xanthomonas sacchari]MCW0380041.1 hypothetical protein [Xanthomonas sacchari]